MTRSYSTILVTRLDQVVTRLDKNSDDSDSTLTRRARDSDSKKMTGHITTNIVVLNQGDTPSQRG